MCVEGYGERHEEYGEVAENDVHLPCVQDDDGAEVERGEGTRYEMIFPEEEPRGDGELGESEGVEEDELIPGSCEVADE